MVRYHGFPLWLTSKENPEKALIEISLEVNTKLLAILTTADVQGRIANDIDDLLFNVALFEEYCHDLDCWGKPYEFKTNLQKVNYFNSNATLDYIPFEGNSFEVYMMSALPGSGKDWFIKNNFKDLPVISLDDLRRKYKASPTDKKMTGRIVQEAKESARVFLRKKESFIWNATNLSKSLRRSLIDLFTTYGANVNIVYIEVPYKVLMKQNMNREYPVPVDIMNKMISKWDVPVLSESNSIKFEV